MLLFTAPGVPSIYYGSEWGIAGQRSPGSDAPLRPALDPATLPQGAPHPALRAVIKRLINLRRTHSALCQGSYQQLYVAHEQLAFLRATAEETLVIAVNAAARAVELRLSLPQNTTGCLADLLNPGDTFVSAQGSVTLSVSPEWARVLQLDRATDRFS